jgi:hypothetical protein
MTEFEDEVLKLLKEILALVKNKSDTISYKRYEALAKESIWLLDQLTQLKNPNKDFRAHNRIMNKIYPNSFWEHLPKDIEE